jgi:hypothetical protein
MRPTWVGEAEGAEEAHHVQRHVADVVQEHDDGAHADVTEHIRLQAQGNGG